MAVLAAGGMDTLPHCGAIITLLAICKLTHKQSYPNIAAVTMAFPVTALIVVITLGNGVPELLMRGRVLARPARLVFSGCGATRTVVPQAGNTPVALYQGLIPARSEQRIKPIFGLASSASTKRWKTRLRTFHVLSKSP
jgi:hypothetical protein